MKVRILVQVMDDDYRREIAECMVIEDGGAWCVISLDARRAITKHADRSTAVERAAREATQDAARAWIKASRTKRKSKQGVTNG